MSVVGAKAQVDNPVLVVAGFVVFIVLSYFVFRSMTGVKALALSAAVDLPGSFDRDDWHARCSFRYAHLPSRGDQGAGFRLAITPER